MLFRRLMLCALLVGALAGAFLSAVQRWQVVPLIAAAERFEAPAVVPAHGEPGHDHAIHHQADAHAGHEHDAEEWEPADGAERTAYTVLANVLTATGFALLLLAAMSGMQAWRGSAPSSATQGLLWGGAGYLAVYVAPALGLPPEIPGAQSAALEARQLWWLLAVAATVGGLSLLTFGRTMWRWAGLLLLAIPHLVGAPQHATLPFAAQAPAAAAELMAIASRFLVATAIVNALYWLTLGGLAAWAFRRWLAMPAAPTGVSAAPINHLRQ